jgi:hypothetical protein
MSRDELDERLRQAAKPEAETVARIVSAALADGEDVSPRGLASFRWLRERRVAVASTASLVAVVSLGAWWWAQEPATSPAGVYRVEAVKPAAPDGVYRVEAFRPRVPPRVTVTASDGTTWIFGTKPNEDWLPAGSSVVIGGGEQR